MIKHLGSKTGKHIIFGGVYSNFQALQALQKKAEEWDIPASNIICTGDIAGYCAQPEECIQAVKDWGIHSICGNVEIQLSSGEESCGCDFIPGSRCDSFSKEWYPYAYSQTSESSKEWMKTLPKHLSFTLRGKSVIVVHGSFHKTSEFIFRSTPWQVKSQNFLSTDADVILSGHCGIAFDHKEGNQTWLNAGVIGMPANDGGQHVWFLTLDDSTGTLTHEFHQLHYDHNTTNALMVKNDLPAAYAKTILTGIWDNCEILPTEETEKQGQPLVFGNCT